MSKKKPVRGDVVRLLKTTAGCTQGDVGVVRASGYGVNRDNVLVWFEPTRSIWLYDVDLEIIDRVTEWTNKIMRGWR